MKISSNVMVLRDTEERKLVVMARGNTVVLNHFEVASLAELVGVRPSAPQLASLAGLSGPAYVEAPSKPPRITAALLERHSACSEQVAAFRAEWPDGAEITVENVLRAGAMGLDIRWLRHLMTEQAWRAYGKAITPASRAYDAAVATARRAYNEALATALREYGAAVAPARRDYDAAVAPALRDYGVAVATARRAYDAANAPALRDYGAAVATASRAYNEALAPAKRAYDEAFAMALVAALLDSASDWEAGPGALNAQACATEDARRFRALAARCGGEGRLAWISCGHEEVLVRGLDGETLGEAVDRSWLSVSGEEA